MKHARRKPDARELPCTAARDPRLELRILPCMCQRGLSNPPRQIQLFFSELCTHKKSKTSLESLATCCPVKPLGFHCCQKARHDKQEIQSPVCIAGVLLCCTGRGGGRALEMSQDTASTKFTALASSSASAALCSSSPSLHDR